MGKSIKELTQLIRNNNDINFGSIISLQLIDDEAERFCVEKKEMIEIINNLCESIDDWEKSRVKEMNLLDILQYFSRALDRKICAKKYIKELTTIKE